MDKKITQYLVGECGKSSTFAAGCIQKMKAHPDVMNAFAEWIELRDFSRIHAPVVMGISVTELHATGKLSPVGVFNYLIYLRNNPEEALDALKRGLPRK